MKMSSKKMSYPLIRPTTPADVAQLLRLQERVYPSITPWHAEHFLQQLQTFAQGQLVAELDGVIVGCASALVILWDEWADEHTWSEITDSGTFKTHNTKGFTLYGAEVFVDPALRGQRIGQALYAGRRRLCRSLNLKRIIACGRLPGYHKHANAMTIELYAKKVLWGDLTDPVLNFQLREGFRYCGIMKGYIPEDVESHGFASLLAWVNPDYEPKRCTGLQSASNPDN